MMTVGSKFPAFRVPAAVSLETGKHFREITQAWYPGKWLVDEVLRTLDALQTGALCPSNWKKGEKTLEVA